MKKITCKIKAACVTKNYLNEHGSVILLYKKLPAIIQKVPKNSNDLNKLLNKLNRLILDNNIDSVYMKIKLDCYSNTCISLFSIRNFIRGIHSQAKWDITCLFFFENNEKTTTHYCYIPSKTKVKSDSR